jgi:hypothetical protein
MRNQRSFSTLPLVAGVLTAVAATTCLTPTATAHYHPKQGRWLQREPLGYVDGMHLYQYVKGNPAVWLDPHGDYAVIDPTGRGSKIRDVNTGRWMSKDDFRSRLAKGGISIAERATYMSWIAQAALSKAYDAFLGWVGGAIIKGFQNIVTERNIGSVCLNGGEWGGSAYGTGEILTPGGGRVYGRLRKQAFVETPQDVLTVITESQSFGIPISFTYHKHAELFFSLRCRDPNRRIVYTVRPRIELAVNGAKRQAYGRPVDHGLITEEDNLKLICDCCARAR